MDESLRRSYLKALGLDNFHSSRYPAGDRFPVTWAVAAHGAGTVSPDADSPGPGLSGQRNATVKNNHARKVMTGIMHESVSKADIEELPGQPPGEENSEGKPKHVPQPEIRFTLEFFRVNPEILVINEAPFSQKSGQQDLVYSLLKAILKALQIAPVDCEQADVFKWPITENAISDNSDLPRAMSALNGFIQRQQALDKLQRIFLFAERFKELLVDDGKLVQVFDSPAIQLVQTRSLYTLLQVPALKKVVWEELLPYVETNADR